VAETPTKRKHRKRAPARSQSRGLLGSRARKAAAVIGAAVLAGIGGLIASAIWSGTGKVLHPSGPPLHVRVVPTGTFLSGTYAPYFIVPDSVAPGPDALPLGARDSPVTFIDPMLARTHEAVAGSPQVIRLRLQGTDDRPVTVNGIHAVVMKRTPPVKGWYVAVLPGCGEEPVRVATIDLDRPAQPVVYDVFAAPPKHFTLSVTRTDIEVIQLHAVTRAAVTWKARIDYSAADGDGSITVDDGGQPFRVSTEVPSRGYEVDYAAAPQRTADLVRQHRWDGKGITTC
jgi:hypothetical protein